MPSDVCRVIQRMADGGCLSRHRHGGMGRLDTPPSLNIDMIGLSRAGLPLLLRSRTVGGCERLGK